MSSAMVRSASISRPRSSSSFFSVYGGSCGAATRQEPNRIRVSAPSLPLCVRTTLGGKRLSASGHTRSPSSETV